MKELIWHPIEWPTKWISSGFIPFSKASYQLGSKYDKLSMNKMSDSEIVDPTF